MSMLIARFGAARGGPQSPRCTVSRPAAHIMDVSGSSESTRRAGNRRQGRFYLFSFFFWVGCSISLYVLVGREGNYCPWRGSCYFCFVPAPSRFVCDFMRRVVIC